MPLAPASPAPPVPPSIPDYRIIKHIGSGAFGHVWFAEELLMPGVFRAVKILNAVPEPGSDSSSSGIWGAERELKGLQLYETRAHGHAHLVQILRVGRTSGDPGKNGSGSVYYAMEIADHAGGAQPFANEDYRPLTLKTLLKYGGRLPLPRAIEYQCQLLDALDHLHKNGLQHRDVKPGNLLFVRGMLKLADLGLMSSDEVRQACGTFAYLPPESKEPNDLYAAGIVLYEMLTGQPASQFPDWPSDLDPGVEPRLASLRKLISRACDRDPQQRFPDAAKFKAALRAIDSPSADMRAQSAALRRIRTIAFVAASISVGAVIVAAWLGYALWGATRGVSYGRPPYDGSVAKLYSRNGEYQFEWGVSDRRIVIPTNNAERRVELFDLQANWSDATITLGGQIRSWSMGNPRPRRVEEAHGKNGEIVQVFLILKTDEIERAATAVANLALEGLEWQRGAAAREKNFDTRFPEEIQLLLDTQLAASPGHINGFMHSVDLTSLGLVPNKTYPVFVFVTAAENHEMYQALAVNIADETGLRIGSVQYAPNPAKPSASQP